MNSLEYLNQNSLRNYPIKDGLSRVSLDGLFTIPNTLVTDLTLSAAGLGSGVFFISGITSNNSAVSIEISVVGGGVFGSFYTTLPNASENFDLILTPAPGYPDAAGLLTIGKLADLASQPSGDFLFDQTSTEILNRCSAQANLGITRITFIDAAGNSYAVSGSVQIVANSNLKFQSNTANRILMNSGEGLGLNSTCSSTANPILTINGIQPDSTGNFTLLADNSCVQINPAQYGVVISDACGAPCLGCTDISTLTSRVNTLETDIFSVRDYINNLQNSLSLATTLVGYQCPS